VLEVQAREADTIYLPGTVGVNLFEAKLLLVSNSSVDQVSNVKVLAVTVWFVPFLWTLKLGPLVAVVTPCHEPPLFLNSRVPALSRKP
jgi:hypothetical protein